MMAMPRQSSVISITLSVLIHAVIIASLLISFKFTTTTHYIIPGKVTMVYLKTRLAPTNHHPHNVTATKIKTTLPQPPKSIKPKIAKMAATAKVQSDYSVTPHAIAVSHNKTVTSDRKQRVMQQTITMKRERPSQNGMASRNQHQLAEKKISGEQLNQLVIYLYKTISQHRVYPEMARELAEQGQVAVIFTLAPSGQVSGLHIAHSSGYHRLDCAALETIRRSAPFVNAGQYLHHPQKLTLSVIYN